MAYIRLFNTLTSVLESFQIDNTPPYLAVSHAWSDQIFPIGTPILSSFGGQVVEKVINLHYPTIHHCWVDNFCIKQNDEADKLVQIPLMGSIYHNAVAVIVVLSCELGLSQEDVDATTGSLTDALDMWKNESWAETAQTEYWKYGPGRQRLVHAMKGLTRFTRSVWGTRIWTLQEYILARSVLWIGTDMQPITIDDMLFQAIPGLCDELGIRECMLRDPGTEFAVLYTHFSGMANCRLGEIDRTRVMELLGNRKASVPVDEVYGVMAASGVEMHTVVGETKEQAWRRWWETAVQRGHVRWAMLPQAPIIGGTPPTLSPNCVIPTFSMRHSLSSSSYLDTVKPLGPPSVTSGTVTLTGRHIGSCKLLRKLGRVHCSASGLIHRDVSLILFSRGRWYQAIQIACAFGAGRYDTKKTVAIAQVLTNNYARALRSVQKRKEEDFAPVLGSAFQAWVWGDFMQLQSLSVMNAMNEGVGFLAQIKNPELGVSITTVAVLGNGFLNGTLEAVDFNAVTGDRRRIFIIVEIPTSNEGYCMASSVDVTKASLHKAGITIPVSDDYTTIWTSLPLQRFSMGGSRCTVCQSKNSPVEALEQHNIPTQQSASETNAKRLKLMLQRERLAKRTISGGLLKIKMVPRKINFRNVNQRRRMRLLVSRISELV